MTFKYDGYNYTLRLEMGELILVSLQKFVKEQNLKGGWVLGLGGLSWAELGFYDLETKQYNFIKQDGPLELANLSGNIAWMGDDPALHLHATVSKTDLSSTAGHLKEAEVSGTVEIFIHRWQEAAGLNRRKDENTGLNLLNL